jgi:hypothetical protein
VLKEKKDLKWELKEEDRTEIRRKKKTEKASI